MIPCYIDMYTTCAVCGLVAANGDLAYAAADADELSVRHDDVVCRDCAGARWPVRQHDGDDGDDDE